MYLPFADEAIVSREKVVQYLLSLQHPHGRGKAFFFERLGFNREHPHELQDALLRLGKDTTMTETRFDYGLKYRGTGIFVSPTGREAAVTTVWMLRNGVPPPWLVTAFLG